MRHRVWVAHSEKGQIWGVAYDLETITRLVQDLDEDAVWRRINASAWVVTTSEGTAVHVENFVVWER